MDGLFAPTHLVILLLVALLLFGAKRLPEIGRSLGTGMREFKHGITGATHDSEQSSLAPTRDESAPS
jgi:sec-independent protein translocase protein TatA